MKSLKHVGKVKSTGAKILVAFRTLPGESDQSLVIPVSNLNDEYHNDIMKLVETDQAQEAFEFGEVLFVRYFGDGRPMLRGLQADGMLVKIPTDNIIMIPQPGSEIPLNQLNVLIAEQRNCAIDDLCKFVSGAPQSNTTVEEIVKVKDLGRDVGEPANVPAQPAAQTLQTNNNEPLSDKDIAKSYRSQADAMYKEAARLRREADDLDPPTKKATKVADAASA